MKEKQRQLAIRLSVDEYTDLQTISYETRKSMADIIRELIARVKAGEIVIEPLPPPGVKK
ncbi:MAG: hypothetical protein K6U04_08620 [Armatimonadetes bacterium]|nr:hypothetical protein [Armatimonadota bacterium]